MWWHRDSSAASLRSCMALTRQICPEEIESGEGWNCSGHVWSHPPHMPSCDSWGLVVHAHTAWLLVALLYPRGLVCMEWILISSAPALTLRSILLQSPPSQQMAIPALRCLPHQNPGIILHISSSLKPFVLLASQSHQKYLQHRVIIQPPPLPAPGISHHFLSPGWPHRRSLLPPWLASSVLLPWQPEMLLKHQSSPTQHLLIKPPQPPPPPKQTQRTLSGH